MKLSIKNLLFLLGAITTGVTQGESTQNGEEARWLVQQSKWATLSWLESGEVTSMITSMAESDGRIFFYLMEDHTFNGSITISESQLNPTQFFGAKCGSDGDLDPEDPRCGKLTLSGVVAPVPEDDDSHQLALDTLFAAHPQMANWPEEHGFTPYEMQINQLWMIANYGGGGYFEASDYFDSDPVHHAAKGFDMGSMMGGHNGGNYTHGGGDYHGHGNYTHGDYGHGNYTHGDYGGDHGSYHHGDGDGDSYHGDQGDYHGEHGSYHHGDGDGDSYHGDHGSYHHGDGDGDSYHGGHGDYHGDHSKKPSFTKKLLPRPDFGSDVAGHARWLVAKSLWTTISTVSSKTEDSPFGNIRSVADGSCFLGSSGLPFFYVPAPDPTAFDIQENKLVTLTFTEAALAERVGEDGTTCGGEDAEDPTCAKITLTGHAVALEDDAKIELAKEAFEAQHPRASWLAKGGGHTGGAYYTLHLHSIMFLRTYGGFATLTPGEYLGWKPEGDKYSNEDICTEVLPNKKEPNGGKVQPSNNEPGASSSLSTSAIILVIIASTLGSFFGGLLSEKAKSYWYGRNPVYAKAGGEDTSLKLAVMDAETV